MEILSGGHVVNESELAETYFAGVECGITSGEIIRMHLATVEAESCLLYQADKYGIIAGVKASSMAVWEALWQRYSSWEGVILGSSELMTVGDFMIGLNERLRRTRLDETVDFRAKNGSSVQKGYVQVLEYRGQPNGGEIWGLARYPRPDYPRFQALRLFGGRLGQIFKGVKNG